MIRKDEILLIFGLETCGNYKKEDFYKLIDKSHINPIYGEVCNTDPDRLDVSLSNVSHIITNLRIVESIVDYLVGDVKILNTPNGRVVKLLYESNIDITFKPRCFVNGNSEVRYISTFDIIDTSTPNKVNFRKLLRDIKINKILN